VSAASHGRTQLGKRSSSAGHLALSSPCPSASA
jgi:hypothetical protein